MAQRRPTYSTVWSMKEVRAKQCCEPVRFFSSSRQFGNHAASTKLEQSLEAQARFSERQ